MEKVEFRDEHRMSRRLSIEFQVPDYAPTIEYPAGDGQLARYWLVPLTVMRRRTLVNLDIRDEDDKSVSMLGMRFTQGLDASMLRAAARLQDLGPGDPAELPRELDKFIDTVIAGEWKDVKDAVKKRAELSTGDLAAYFEKDAFVVALERMWHNFTLYSLLPVASGRHRRLRLAFDEPVDWVYQRSTIERHAQTESEPPRPEVLRYRPFSHRRSFSAEMRARLGVAATRVRVLTPSAESCASYHFEFSAPPGLRIAQSRFLAGRPNEVPGARKLAIDCDDEGGRVAGLHAVDIPHGSLSRAQVELRVDRSGWLGTLAASCLVAFVSLLSVAYHYGRREATADDDGLLSIFTFLLAITAGGATFVAHQATSPVTMKMLTGLRAVGAFGVAMPAVAGILLVLYEFDPSASPPDLVTSALGAFGVEEFNPGWWWRIYLPLVLSGLSAAVVGLAWWAGGTRFFSRNHPLSPWKMTGIEIHDRVEESSQEQWEDARPPRSLSVTRTIWAHAIAGPRRLLGALPRWLRRRRQEYRKPIFASSPDLMTNFLGAEQELEFDTWAIGVPSAEGWHETFDWTADRQKTIDLVRSGTTGCSCELVHPAARPADPLTR